MAGSVPDPSLFKSGRQSAAWLGPAPKVYSEGCKERQVGINKTGEGYLRRLLVIGVTAVFRIAPPR